MTSGRCVVAGQVSAKKQLYTTACFFGFVANVASIKQTTGFTPILTLNKVNMCPDPLMGLYHKTGPGRLVFWGECRILSNDAAMLA